METIGGHKNGLRMRPCVRTTSEDRALWLLLVTPIYRVMRGSELGSRVHSSIFIVNPDAEFCLDTWSLGLYLPLGLYTNLQDCRMSRIWGFKYQPFWVYLPRSQNTMQHYRRKTWWMPRALWTSAPPGCEVSWSAAELRITAPTGLLIYARLGELLRPCGFEFCAIRPQSFAQLVTFPRMYRETVAVLKPHNIGP